jgi:hypothetical protein
MLPAHLQGRSSGISAVDSPRQMRHSSSAPSSPAPPAPPAGSAAAAGVAPASILEARGERE